ncbi:hypothetical protein PLESTF_001143100 [Pleodorina starrii]|nr:hypothetical protein PLESTF_001143100 [Pleodorina starrii]
MPQRTRREKNSKAMATTPKREVSTRTSRLRRSSRPQRKVIGWTWTSRLSKILCAFGSNRSVAEDHSQEALALALVWAALGCHTFSDKTRGDHWRHLGHLLELAAARSPWQVRSFTVLE